MRKIIRTYLGIATACLPVFVISVLYANQVDNSLTEFDKKYAPIYLQDVQELPETPTYEEELDFIRDVQTAVLRISPESNGIPEGEKRELRHLYEAGAGLCYDRSRAIEKLLRYSNFETRHISIFSTKNSSSTLEALLTPGVESHAVTEVLTQYGWMVVDSNDAWLSIDVEKRPISIEEMQNSIESSNTIDWHAEPPSFIYHEPFTFVLGLYSRHGEFYPPFNFVPDIHYPEFIQNF